ncbi:MAG: zinc ribbon domain-containing protein [Chloroflexi bacterium]|nr:zinc ribbon domain-containing protein [Chloroflexota bacterium]
MERRILHGSIKPGDIAHALRAEFNRGNLHAQTVGNGDRLAVQIATRLEAQSGGQTAMTVAIQKHPDGVIIEIGQQAWLGVAASLGKTAISALRNPLSLLGRLDDLAQDIENLQLQERVWRVVDRTAAALGASRELSERLQRVVCAYCGTANPLGEGACLACGAPLGDAHPTTCPNCGFALGRDELVCPNCKRKL